MGGKRGGIKYAASDTRLINVNETLNVYPSGYFELFTAGRVCAFVIPTQWLITCNFNCIQLLEE